MANIDKDGLTVCPHCQKHYIPKLGQRRTNRLIQEEFPNATAEEREQLVSGICSDKCWDEMFGEEE